MTDAQWCPIAQKFCHCDQRCEDVEAVNAYVDRMIRKEIAARHEGGPEHDLDTRGNPMRPGR